MATTVDLGDGKLHTVENVTIHLGNREPEEQSVSLRRNADGITSAELLL